MQYSYILFVKWSNDSRVTESPCILVLLGSRDKRNFRFWVVYKKKFWKPPILTCVQDGWGGNFSILEGDIIGHRDGKFHIFIADFKSVSTIIQGTFLK